MNKIICLFPLFVILLWIGSLTVFGQDKVNIYNPSADAKKDIAEAVKKARAENKNVYVQVGGNWCGWCVKLHSLYMSNEEIRNFLDENFVEVRVNYSPEKKNLDVLASLGYPQRFGFPVIVILDRNGNRIHTQDTGLLEENGAHSPEKVLHFLTMWSPKATDPASYPEK